MNSVCPKCGSSMEELVSDNLEYKFYRCSNCGYRTDIKGSESDFPEIKTGVFSNISLRDYFAGQIIPFVLKRYEGEPVANLVKTAYKIADTMIRESNKEENNKWQNYFY